MSISFRICFECLIWQCGSEFRVNGPRMTFKRGKRMCQFWSYLEMIWSKEHIVSIRWVLCLVKLAFCTVDDSICQRRLSVAWSFVWSRTSLGENTGLSNIIWMHLKRKSSLFSLLRRYTRTTNYLCAFSKSELSYPWLSVRYRVGTLLQARWIGNSFRVIETSKCTLMVFSWLLECINFGIIIISEQTPTDKLTRPIHPKCLRVLRRKLWVIIVLTGVAEHDLTMVI